MHYARFRKTGSTELVRRPQPTSEQRFFAKVEQSGDCWLWMASTSWGGYGIFRCEARNVVAHRWCYEFLVAPIPDGLHLDHLCKVRACVNPRHLDPVPQAVNNRRSEAGRVNAERLGGATHCQREHEFTPENTRIIHGGRHRQCKTCHSAAVRARRARLREEAATAL